MSNLIHWPRLLAVLALGLLVWFTPAPWDLSVQAWRLFAIFLTTILAVLIEALPVLIASLLAMVTALFTGTLTVGQAYSGFSQNFILLIMTAFLLAKGMIKSGLGQRLAYLLIRRFGQSTLRLGYCLFATDAIISPAFASNTARSGVLYTITYSLAVDTGSRPNDPSAGNTGSYLMMIGIASLTISSAMFLTAMAVNPVGVEIARDLGVAIDFGSWALAAFAPSLAAIVVLPYLIYRVYPPRVKKTPEAPAAAAAALRDMGPMSRHEWIMALTFAGVVVLWALAGTLKLDMAAVAFLGLAALMLGGVFTVDDLRREGGDALETLLWFGILYTLSTYLNEFGFMGTLGSRVADRMQGLSWPVTFVALTCLYILIHYLFVSQTAHLLALFAVFLKVAIDTGVPGPLAAFMLLFATNFFAGLTPQASSANILFAGSGYMRQADVYRVGGLMTLVNTLIYLIIGTPWILAWFGGK